MLRLSESISTERLIELVEHFDAMITTMKSHYDAVGNVTLTLVSAWQQPTRVAHAFRV